MSRWARVTLRTGVLLALGAGTALAVALTAALRPHPQPPSIGSLGLWVDWQTHRTWSISKRTDQFASSRWSVEMGAPAAPLRPESWMGVPPPQGFPEWFIEIGRDRSSWSAEFRMLGWPRKCLWGAAAGAESLSAIDAFGAASPTNPRGVGGRVPIGPLWPGLLVNTLFYAAAWLAASVASVRLRAGVRTWRGRCVRCGYDLRRLAQNAPCPECGKVSAKRRAPKDRMDT